MLILSSDSLAGEMMEWRIENARRIPGYHVHPDLYEKLKNDNLGRPVFIDERLVNPDDWYLITEDEITDQQYAAICGKMTKKD